MKYYDRKKGQYVEEKESGQKALDFLYKNPFGRLILKLAINPTISKVYGVYNNSSFSTRKIDKFIADNGIDMRDFEKRKFTSFNDFFTRKLSDGAREICMEKESFISPCDSKLLAYKITEDLMVDIKGSTYNLSELVGNKVDTSSFNGGWCLIFRLCVDDYHRYIYLDDGRLEKNLEIQGKLHTVRSISKDYRIYKENSRTVSLFQTENFGEIIQIEVGAMFIGKVTNNNKENFKKGDEKGFFEFGGSTIAVLVQDKKIELHQDILDNSRNDIESKVRCGEVIGRKIC